jgi:hypothetical protein
MRTSRVFVLGAIMADEFLQDTREDVSEALRAGQEAIAP